MTSQIQNLFEQFSSGLAQVFESMTEQRPGITCDALPDPPEAEEILWWEQPLQLGPEMKIWAGAPRSVWEYAGTLTLKAAGIESVEEREARNTWLEILSQALSPLARAIGNIVGREVVCEGGAEQAPEAGVEEWISLRMTFGERQVAPFFMAFSAPLMEAISTPRPAAQPEPEPGDQADGGATLLPVRSRTMSLLLDVDLPVSISFGRTQLAMRDVIKLTTGSIVELNRGVSEPVEVLVNGSLVARGEVVVVDGNYGVRILQIVSRQDRMRTLR